MLVGLATSVGIAADPTGLHAPPWVAHIAAFTFVLAGLGMIAQDLRQDRVHRWTVGAILFAFLGLGAWIALGPGARQCSLLLPTIVILPPAIACRIAFGIGAVLVAGMLGRLIWSASPR